MPENVSEYRYAPFEIRQGADGRPVITGDHHSTMVT